ncbi:MAG: 50S ribosomal protein L13 [Candidatus Aenigmarchaeota archaeon]|nr:50S ribosomal protein L13 [Candidatus Aenigmarchaeota archaeon]
MATKKTDNKPKTEKKQVKTDVKKTEKEKVRYIDAKNCIAGRLCSQVAKMLLKGEKVFVFNASDVVVSGNKVFIQQDFLHETVKGDPYHGPFYPKESEKIIKRITRGMLPKKPRGMEALKNLKVFSSLPAEFKDTKTEVLEKTVNKLECKYSKLGDISKFLGAK